MMVNKTGERRHPSLVLNVREKAPAFLPLSVMLTIGFGSDLFLQRKCYLSS